MVGTRPHLRDFPSRPALKLAILQHGEIHPANGYVGKVNTDATVHRRRIGTIRQVPRLLALHLVDVFHRELVAPVGAARER